MPEQENSIPSNNGNNSIPQTSQSETNETFMAHAMQIMSSNSYTPTQAQVDKMLSLQEKGMDYLHHERTHFSPTLIANNILFVFISITIVGLFVFCIFHAPQYASQILSLAVGALGGGIGGYGLGSRNRKKN